MCLTTTTATPLLTPSLRWALRFHSKSWRKASKRQNKWLTWSTKVVSTVRDIYSAHPLRRKSYLTKHNVQYTGNFAVRCYVEPQSAKRSAKMLMHTNSGTPINSPIPPHNQPQKTSHIKMTNGLRLNRLPSKVGVTN